MIAVFYEPVFYAPHKFQSRPDFGDRTYFHVDQAGRQPISRTTFSSRSVATPELFLGQLTHSIPAGASRLLMRSNSSRQVRCRFREQHREIERGLSVTHDFAFVQFGAQFGAHIR